MLPVSDTFTVCAVLLRSLLPLLNATLMLPVFGPPRVAPGAYV